MKIKTKLFLPILAMMMIMMVPISGATTAKVPTNSVVFEGHINGTNLAGKVVEYYVNHSEQNTTSPIVLGADGKYSYHIVIPFNIFPAGSTVTFKIDDQVYGFAILEFGKHILNLAMDEQSH